jgi:DNA-binding NarL/FixJ family response regulator
VKNKKRDAKGSPSSSQDEKKILLVDDHPLVREGIATLIRAEPDLRISAEAGSAAEALQAIEEEMPDLVLLDISLPGTSGIELLKDLHIRYPRLFVLVLSMHEESVYAERALRAGAHGYIMKQEPGAKVVEAVRCVLRGELYVSPSLAARMVKLFVANKQGKDSRTSVERLSDRELQVYSYIGSGLSTQEVAAKLHLSVKTIQTYREHIKRKLGLRNATDLVHHATHWVENEAMSPAGQPAP